MNIKTALKVVLVCTLVSGCAGFQRSCTSDIAGMTGADWIVVQNDYTMQPKRCWKLPNTSISNEEHTDGIYWLDPHSTHLVHISGWYNRVQVSGGDWDGAAKALGIDPSRCADGVYQ